MASVQNQVNFTKALKLVKKEFSLENVRSLVVASSVILRQGISLTYEQIDELIQIEAAPKFVKETVVYHENLSISRYYKVVYEDQDCSLLKNCHSNETILVKSEWLSKYKPCAKPLF